MAHSSRQSLPRNPATVTVIKDALVTWAINYRAEITTATRELWLKRFAYMDPDLVFLVLETVTRRVKGFLPTVADAYDVMEEVQASAHQLAAEQAWKEVKAFLDFWNGNFDQQCLNFKPSEAIATSEKTKSGIYICKPRTFDAATNYAIGTLRGYGAAAHRTIKDEHFHEKNFLEAHIRFQTTDGLQILGRAEAAEILSKLQNDLAARDKLTLTEGAR